MRHHSAGSVAQQKPPPPTSAPGSPLEAASRSWSHFYDAPLTWNVHLTNVLHHTSFLLELRRLRPKRILEVGAGTGSLAIFLSYFCRDVVSVDIDEDILRRCRENNRRFRGRVSFVRADAFTLDCFPPGSFDVAVSQGFFEHFADDQIATLLRQQLRAARRAVFSVPNVAYGKQDFGDERLLTKQLWDRLLVAAGCEVERSRDYRPVTRWFWKEPAMMYLAVVSSGGGSGRG